MVAVLTAGSKSQPGTIDGIWTVAVTVTESPPPPSAQETDSQSLIALTQPSCALRSSEAARAPALAAVPACWAV